mmetsp:Transcript_30357/g.93699  ORF Transcript_30357/g.93699 Transcript_30357/m.93699 type:complete len:214 (-) Transcript_30357:2502-3143(-)
MESDATSVDVAERSFDHDSEYVCDDVAESEGVIVGGRVNVRESVAESALSDSVYGRVQDRSALCVTLSDPLGVGADSLPEGVPDAVASPVSDADVVLLMLAESDVDNTCGLCVSVSDPDSVASNDLLALAVDVTDSPSSIVTVEDELSECDPTVAVSSAVGDSDAVEDCVSDALSETDTDVVSDKRCVMEIACVADMDSDWLGLARADTVSDG